MRYIKYFQKILLLYIICLVQVSTIVAQWTQVGQDIDGDEFASFFGASVSISSDGQRVVIGAPLYSNGQVKIYENVENFWSLQDIVN